MIAGTPTLQPPPTTAILADVERALVEDVGSGDLTAALIAADASAHAHILCREDAVLAGRPWAEACFRQLDAGVHIDWHFEDGTRVPPNAVLCHVEGNARALVAGERNALNFLQLLSGTATVTRRYVDAVAGTPARILDTRKTLPGLRLAQKYAVRCGGGHNHRLGLYDAMLIKENHVTAAGGIGNAIRAARAAHPGVFLDCEVESLDELRDAIGASADRILLDEFSDAMLRDAVALTAGRVPLEVSGSVNLERVRAIAETGVDCISIGALTKNVRAIDLSMRFEDA
ncbi:MAG TPA: carboxylating nicotinate-nucleotide diphosphorylase [Rhodanobacteraceae bacterium]|nr:carboxylating nicotinate-nucleotide diphosphorylase [Rhodanobacteraceae bacterium]